MTFHRIGSAFSAGLVLLLLALPATAQQSYDHDEIIEDQFAVSSGTLVIDADRGSVVITGHSGNNVEVTITKGANDISASDADDLFDRYEVTIDETSNGLRIIGEYDKPNNSWRRFNKLRVHYEIGLPSNMSIDIHTSGGSIQATNVSDAYMKTSGGSIKIADIDGPVEAKTSGGSITAEAIGGVAELNTSGGSIRLKDIGGEVHARTSGGTIQMEDINGSVDAKTSGGSIKLAGVVGHVTAQTSGGGIQAEILGMLDDDVHLQTSGGSITVQLDDDVRATINASASGGSVRTDFPVTVRGEVKRNKLNGTINGGGPMLTLRTSGGGVRILEN